MTLALLAAPAIVVAGALLNRHRGGWVGTGHTQVARADFALGMAILLALALGSWWALAAAPLMFAGCLPGQGEDAADDTALHRLGLVASGAANFAGCAVAAAVLEHRWEIALVALGVGALKPLAYWPALHDRLPEIRRLWPGGSFAVGREWGEVLFGVAHGAGIVAIAALG